MSFSENKRRRGGGNVVLKAVTHYPKTFALAKNTITIFLFYLICGLIYFHLEKDWYTEDIIYFITVTITTVGYGDFSPTTDRSRIFTIFVILFGLIFIFSIINDFATSIIKAATENAAKITKTKMTKNIVVPSRFKYAGRYAYPVVTIIMIILGGSVFLWLNEEDWSFVQAVYMCFVTTTTVGYGDFYANTKSSRWFMIFYIPISVCAVAAALGSFTSIGFEIEAERKRLKALQRKLDFKMIREMDLDGDGVDKCEFLVAMLVQNELCEQKDIDPWLDRFDELDKDGSGKLDEEDIRILEKEEEERLETMERILSSESQQPNPYVIDAVTVGNSSNASSLPPFVNRPQKSGSDDSTDCPSDSQKALIKEDSFTSSNA